MVIVIGAIISTLKPEIPHTPRVLALMAALAMVGVPPTPAVAAPLVVRV
jgi:hypothetical protein